MKRLLFLLTACGAVAAHGDQIKADNNIHLELGGSWVSGNPPGATDNAIWDATVTTPANTLGAPAAWKGIVIRNPRSAVSILGTTILTNGSGGIDLSAATVDLTIDCGALDLGANQSWNIAAGRTLTTVSSVSSPNNGNFIITKTGAGIWTSSGSTDNGSIGVILNGGVFNLNKSAGSAHAVGGPGLTINSGTAIITGTGGDQIYDGGGVTLTGNGVLDLNGQRETIGSLAGAGGTVESSALGSVGMLTVAGSGTFNGALRNALSLVKTNSGTLTLGGSNSYSGGTTVSGGTLALSTTNNAPMPYVINSGTLSVRAADNLHSLAMTRLASGVSGAQMTFNLGGMRNLGVPLVSDSGNLVLTGPITVNVQNLAQSGSYVLLQYAGSRSGTGGFVAGSLPSGATITDDTVNKILTLTYTSLLEPRVIVPTLNTNEVVVAVATPQQYGAHGDGITDDSAAFQAAMNAAYNSGGAGGGVVFVPAGNYAFYHNITIPTGVTLHGDWTDWSKGAGGMTGTTFKVYFGAGQTTNAPFITLSASTALRGINIWHPNQDAANIVSYPYAIGVDSDCVVQNVALIDAYQGIETVNGGGDKNILSTVIGSPLWRGIDIDQVFDVCHAEDIRFSPDIWAASLVSNAPAFGGPQAAWMRANGEAMRFRRVDGEMCMDTFISGYSVGIEANAASNGQPGMTFYGGAVSNCGTALLAQDMPSAFGLMFAWFTLDGNVAVNRTNTADAANAMFDHCTIIGRNGPAVSSTGADWHSWMQFQDCAISNALQLTGPGVFNAVDCAFSGVTNAILSATATRAAFTGCTFSGGPNIVNHGNAGNVLVDARAPQSNTLPIVYWTNVAQDFLSRHAAKTNLYVATEAPWGAYGDGSHDDSAALQSTLDAAGANGGGIVYLPAGKYRLTNTLDVPAGVELRGSFEMRHRTWPGNDGHAKGTILEPLGGQGTTNGPPAIALEAGAGLVGVTISYETQNTNCIPFPPTIQGRGPNVYAIGVCCPNPYYYVDLDTYTCTNHFLDMVDGWALRLGYNIGHGSSGTIVDCHCNWTYWIDNLDSQSSLPQSIQAPVLSFVSHYLRMYELGDCAETMVKDFSIIENEFARCSDENGRGPNVTLINNYCDATIRGFVLDAAAPCQINAVNTPMTTFNFGGYGDLAQATVAVLSTTNFQGTARFFGSVLWGGTYLDFVVNGGDVGFDLAHMDTHSFIGSVVNGGVFHLINNSAYISYSGTSNFPPYNVFFSPGSGKPGATSEFIGCYAYNGCTMVNASTNPVNAWNDFGLSSYAQLDPTLPVLYGISPNGEALFQYTDDLDFAAASAAGIETSNITVQINGVTVTNLAFSGSPANWEVSYTGLAVNRAYTATLTARDDAGRVVAATVSFDTFAPDNFTFEAEDYDYGGGHFVSGPQTNGYAGLAAVDLIDCHNASGGDAAYRPNPSGLATENAGDLPRAAYDGLEDYDVGWNNGGNWGNYTRLFPPGVYNIYMRAASPNGSPVTIDAASLAVVTGGLGTVNQTFKKLGTFDVPNTGDWHGFAWVALKNASGDLVRLTNNGAAQTLRITTDNGGYNVNFYELAPTTLTVLPVSLTAATSGAAVNLSFLTQVGFRYQAQYKDNLTDADWNPIGAAVSGDGSIQTIQVPAGGASRFYRMQIQPL
ncbi:MAG TPA: glycosyl hydrolase family 28-related protein [Verrucomicrobiae bacterium]|jgi:autotransporter-associated beta strand protein|nr:glycosyl hydrolase family 28-related protein [Verrucomicrobiae bacterium]